MEKIGEKIKQIRTQKGLSQELLAEEAKVNLRTIQRIENNESEPRGKTLTLLCEVLEVNVEDLVEYGKKNRPNFFSCSSSFRTFFFGYSFGKYSYSINSMGK